MSARNAKATLIGRLMGRPAHCCADFEVARSRQADRLAKARLIETILELLHQDLETQFAGAVAGCDALDLELFIERRRNPLHFLHWRYHEMKATGDGIKLWIDRGGILKHFVRPCARPHVFGLRIRTAKSPSNVIGRKRLPSLTKIPQGNCKLGFESKAQDSPYRAGPRPICSR